MNNNATMVNRLIAVFLDLITYLGLLVGLSILLDSTTDANFFFHLDKLTQQDRLILLGKMIGGFYIFDVVCTRLLSTTPGKLCVNCDVDFHSGNSIIHNIIRSLIKVLCLFTLLPAIASYVHAANSDDNKTYHDLAVRTSVTNTTRTPRFIGLLFFFAALALIVFFLINYHDKIGFSIDILGLKHYKIFDLG